MLGRLNNTEFPENSIERFDKKVSIDMERGRLIDEADLYVKNLEKEYPDLEHLRQVLLFELKIFEAHRSELDDPVRYEEYNKSRYLAEALAKKLNEIELVVNG